MSEGGEVSRRGGRLPGLRSLRPGRVPDPLRAHGAWVYLVVSILAGALTGSHRGFAPGLFAGGSFVGLFVLASSLAVAGSRAARVRWALGLLLAVASSLLGLGLGAGAGFLVVSLIAGAPALAAAYFAASRGFLSPGALSFAVTALVVSAPVAAFAAGAPLRAALGMLAILTPVYFWRTWRLARALGPGWTKQRFQRRGLLESALAIGWAAVALVIVRSLG